MNAAKKKAASLLTDWFPPSVDPMHVGLYNASLGKNEHVMRWWDGKFWSFVVEDKYSKNAHELGARASDYAQANMYWRGIAVKP